MLFIGGGVPVRAPGYPSYGVFKDMNLVSIEDTYRASEKKILKIIRRENFEKNIV